MEYALLCHTRVISIITIIRLLCPSDAFAKWRFFLTKWQISGGWKGVGELTNWRSVASASDMTKWLQPCEMANKIFWKK